MKDILIILDNGKPIFDESFIGINRENLQKNIIFKFKDTFIDGNANLEVKIDNDDGVITNLTKVGESYVLPIRSSLLTSDKVLMQLVIYQAEVDEETPIYKSEIIYLKVKESLNASGDIPEEYPTWTETLSDLYDDVQALMQETETALENIPTKTSDLTNDSGFITKNVNDLTYYSKTDVMNANIFEAVGSEATLRQNADNNLQSQIDAITSASDVIDIVGTYQDLQNYDTSSLTPNDIIKVLEDSTHDNAVSYYRWTNNSWSYVGSESPTYTKSETDALLNQKQNVIDSSHKLSSDLVDDTGHSHKFATAEQLTQISTNASNITTINNNLSLKEDKANKVTSISVSSTDTEYPSAKCVYDSQVLQDNKTNEIENKVEYYATIMNALPKITGTGTSITLNNTANSPMGLELQPSELSQEGTPNPDYPQDIHVISGDSTIKVENKNLFDVTQFETLLVQNKRLNDNGEEVTDNSSWYSTYKIPLIANVQYHIKGAFQRIYFYDSTGSFIRRSSDYGSVTNISYTPTNNEYISFQIYVTNWNNNKGQEQVEIGSSATSYVEHKEQDFSITLGDLEYCKIGTYADEFIKATNEAGLTAGKWYLKKVIDKDILNGSEDWTFAQNQRYFYLTDSKYPRSADGSTLYPMKSNQYIPATFNEVYNATIDYGIAFPYNNDRLYVRNKDVTSLETFESDLNTNNLILYYLGKTSQYILLNDTLQEQLENIYNYVLGYKDQTNISQTNNDLPFVINASAVKDLSNL